MKTIFIIPYRDRLEHLYFFKQYAPFVLNNSTIYEVYFVHQKDDRPFNRGAMKNVGFIAMKHKYPDTYRDMTFIFNDIDILPYTKGIFDYSTRHGVIKHYYGYENSLGGSFAIKGGDFEKINGFPNIWSYGLEDSLINDRAIKGKLKIDRSQFHRIGAKEVLQLFDGINRLVDKNDNKTIIEQYYTDGHSTIINNNNASNLRYSIHTDTPCETENGDHSRNTPASFFMIDVHNFKTGISEANTVLFIDSIMNIRERGSQNARRQPSRARVGLM